MFGTWYGDLTLFVRVQVGKVYHPVGKVASLWLLPKPVMVKSLWLALLPWSAQLRISPGESLRHCRPCWGTWLGHGTEAQSLISQWRAHRAGRRQLEAAPQAVAAQTVMPLSPWY